MTSIMDLQPDPPVIRELLEWCSKRLPGREARRSRVPLLFAEFRDIINEQFPIITVTGTSGKGTTCALLESVLAASGHTAGVCIKPHLFSFRERIRVAGKCVSNSELSDHAHLIWARLREFVRKNGEAVRPSLFEALLIVAVSIFRQRGVTIAVFEAAIGGSNDATSFLPAMLSVITSVGLDHQDELGNSIEEIARDKAGIAPPGGILVMGAGLSESARSTVAAENARRGVRSVQAVGDVLEVLSRSVQGQRIRFSHDNKSYTLFLPFPGPHQVLNFALVWKITQVLHDLRYINDLDAINGVQHAHLPGRFEFIHGAPSWLLDVAHNPASIEALISTASEHFSRERMVVVLGATEPHDYRSFVKLMCTWGIQLGFVEGFPRAVPASKLAAEVPDQTRLIGLFSTPGDAIDYLVDTKAYPEKTVIVTGSLFLVGLWRHELVRRGLLAGEE